MGWISWAFGVGLPTIIGLGALGLAAWAWFRVPFIGHYIGLALVALGVGSLAWGQGYSSARATCNEAAVQAELASVRRDLDAAHEAAAFAVRQSRLLADAERKNKELADELESLPDACRAESHDVKRLLGIKP